MSEAFFAALAAVLSSILTAGGAYLLQRRKLDGSEDRADRDQAVEHWGQLAKRLTRRIEALEARIDELGDEHAKCQAENAELRRRVQQLEAIEARRSGEAPEPAG